MMVVLYAAAILVAVGVAMFVAAPLLEGERRERARSHGLELERAEREWALVVQALREIEFDRQMRKLSESDCEQLRRGLEARALSAMASVENLRGLAPATDGDISRSSLPRTRGSRKRRSARDSVDNHLVSSARAAQGAAQAEEAPRADTLQIRFCPACGTPTVPPARFCAECGLKLQLLQSA